jgi:hypothetical protein
MPRHPGAPIDPSLPPRGPRSAVTPDVPAGVGRGTGALWVSALARVVATGRLAGQSQTGVSAVLAGRALAAPKATQKTAQPPARVTPIAPAPDE